jgi:hypothetical protein
LNPFSQLPAVKKEKNGAARKLFGPSYFDLVLVIVLPTPGKNSTQVFS